MKTTKQSKSTATCPTEVKIVGKTYKIEWLEHLANQGETFHAIQTIKIEITDKAKEQMQDTVLHEVMHGIDYAMQAKLSERQVTVMATGLLAVLKENPNLMRYLLESQ